METEDGSKGCKFGMSVLAHSWIESSTKGNTDCQVEYWCLERTSKVMRNVGRSFHKRIHSPQLMEPRKIASCLLSVRIQPQIQILIPVGMLCRMAESEPCLGNDIHGVLYLPAPESSSLRVAQDSGDCLGLLLTAHEPLELS